MSLPTAGFYPRCQHRGNHREHEANTDVRPNVRPPFRKPEVWRAFLSEIEARTGQRVADLGLFAAASNYWTAADLDEAERLLDAIICLAEHDPLGLDVDLHGWARLRRQDIREARHWWARRHGHSRTQLKRREAERALWRHSAMMRGEGVIA